MDTEFSMITGIPLLEFRIQSKDPESSGTSDNETNKITEIYSIDSEFSAGIPSPEIPNPEKPESIGAIDK